VNSTILGRIGPAFVVPALLAWVGGAAARADGPAAGAPPAADAKPAAEPPGAAPAALPPKDKAKPPPKYENLRFREDWSSLLCAGPCARQDGSDHLKALRISSGAWLNFGGQVRARFESFDSFQFSAAPAADDDWMLYRVRLHADLHLGRHLRVFAEGIYADQDERLLGPRATDEDHGDLLNAFVDLTTRTGGVDVGARVGRQELLFGKQRVIGPLDWGNTRRTFDGVSGWVKGCNWRLDGFYVQPVLVDIDAFDEADDTVDFAGLYYASKPSNSTVFEAYALHTNRDGKRWLGVTEAEERLTLGAGAWGPIGGSRLDYDVEAAYQLGSAGDGDVNAWMATAELGWKPCVECWEPRFAIGLDYASGDDDGPGGDVGTYDQLFPTGHLWFGWVDAVGRQNVIAARLTASAKPSKEWFVRADLHAFWRASGDDSLYNAAGADIRAPVAGASDEIGTELDLMVKWQPNRHWEVEAGYGWLWAGPYLTDTGSDEDIRFLWLGATFTF
jgi:hypothetical protein